MEGGECLQMESVNSFKNIRLVYDMKLVKKILSKQVMDDNNLKSKFTLNVNIFIYVILLLENSGSNDAKAITPHINMIQSNFRKQSKTNDAMTYRVPNYFRFSGSDIIFIIWEPRIIFLLRNRNMKMNCSQQYFIKKRINVKTYLRAFGPFNNEDEAYLIYPHEFFAMDSDQKALVFIKLTSLGIWKYRQKV